MDKKKYKCPCCGYYTYKDEPMGNYDICPVCFWEDDPFAYDDPEEIWSCNGVSLSMAKQNFKKFRACKEEMIKYVREPKADELCNLT